MNDFINTMLPCSCGKEHHFNIQGIEISHNAISLLPSFLKEDNYKKPFFVYDMNTYQVAGKIVEEVATLNHISFEKIVLSYEYLVPDETSLGEILTAYDRSCDIIIGVGSGTINDLCRFVSFQLHLPFYIIATAASMDGYASDCAPLITKNMKVTYQTHTPSGIIASTEILKNTSLEMISAGVGDILGKYTSLCDWELSHLVTGEYYCPFITDLVKKSMATMVDNLAHIPQKEEKVIGTIMEALVLSGIAMSYAGNSRPASGSEHHLSHYWEMQFLFKGRKPILHGTKVGVATVMVLKMYEHLKNSVIDFDRAMEKAQSFSKTHWELDMKRMYRSASTQVIALEKTAQKNKSQQIVKRIEFYKANWNQIIDLLNQNLPTSQAVEKMLTSINAPTSPAEIGVDDQMFVDSVLGAKELRNRFGLLQLLFDLGISKEVAESVISGSSIKQF